MDKKIVVKGFSGNVGEIKEFLNLIPDYYSLRLSGLDNFSIMVDHENSFATIDESPFIEEMVEEKALEEYMDEEQHPNSVYLLISHSDICENGNREAEICGAFSSSLLCDEAGAKLPQGKAGDYYEVQRITIDNI